MTTQLPFSFHGITISIGLLIVTHRSHLGLRPSSHNARWTASSQRFIKNTQVLGLPRAFLWSLLSISSLCFLFIPFSPQLLSESILTLLRPSLAENLPCEMMSLSTAFKCATSSSQDRALVVECSLPIVLCISHFHFIANSGSAHSGLNFGNTKLWTAQSYFREYWTLEK